MQINSPFPTRAANSTNGTNQAAAQTQTLNQNDFLQLLSTQLANQDPTKPVDNDQLVSQLAQLSTVDGIATLNKTVTGIADRLE